MLIENIGMILIQSGANSDEAIHRIKHLIRSSGEPIILNAIMEHWSIQSINYVLELLGVTKETTNVTLYLEDSIDVEQVNFNNIVTLNHGLLKTAKHCESFSFNTEINLSSNKFLYLMGKPYKKHRVGLLYELYLNQLLKNCEWSFYYNPLIADITRNQLPDLSDIEYETFISSTTRSLDLETSDMVLAKNISDYPGYPIDNSLFSKTSFSLISETLCDPNYGVKFTTEKVWRTIANNHAFVMVSYDASYDWLESLGVDTFQYMLKHKKDSFASNRCIEDIIKMTTENVEYFLDNISKHESRIKESISHNRKVYTEQLYNLRKKVPTDQEDTMLIPYCSVLNSAHIQ